MKTYQPSLFADNNRLEALLKPGDPLMVFSKRIHFEMFRPKLEEAFRKEDRKSPAGRIIAHIKEELLLVLGTSSSETALPGMIPKMEALGCAKSTVGVIIPTGYRFNLDGTNI